MEKRYKVLRTVSFIYKLIGITAGIITVIIALAICATSLLSGAAIDSMLYGFGNDPGFGGYLGTGVIGIIFSFISILYGGLFALTFYAFGEGINLLIALEENTRATAHFSRRNLIPPTNEGLE